MTWTGLEPGERPYRDAAWFYAEYRYRPSEAFARLLAAHLGWSASDRVLDLGAGPAHASLRYAPFVGEVVVMDPEPDMIEEGRRRAAAAGIDNLTFVVGGSDDLSVDLGEFTAVTISHAFHWMADQDAVLRALDRLVDRKRGAVAIVGYVKDPSADAAWFDRPPWNVVGSILREHLTDVPEGPNPRGRHDPFPDLLGRSAFSRVELLSYEHERTVRPSVDAAIGFPYTLSNVLDRLGDRRSAFEADVRAALADADTSPFTVRVVDSALIGRRP
ncbi:MAG TPA: methyltransferase domain-containing protein [Gaiellaceae bacterium]|jgi:SAM-dependent methyltransferase